MSKYRVCLIGVITILCLIACKTEHNKKRKKEKKIKENIVLKTEPTEDKEVRNPDIRIDQTGLYAVYRGVEFTDTGNVVYRDLAHQLSNRVADTLGKYLKEQFKAGNYLSIDFKKTQITTAGMDMRDTVVYCITMIFKSVNKCEASTGIEHCGSWGNQPDNILKMRLDETLKKMHNLYVGTPKTMKYVTKENFKEYWIQFKHKKYQGDCY